MQAPLQTENERRSHTKSPSIYGNVPPRNPNKRPTTINMQRSIGRMKAEDRNAIRQSQT